MEDLLTKAGLSDAEAQVYLYLLSHGQSAPPVVAKALGLTRSNAYKVLESLQAIGLATSTEVRKKLAYEPADPTALASLVAEERNRVIALELTVKDAMQQLRTKYHKSTGASRVSTGRGQAAIIHAYEQQAEAKEPIYFIKSRADIPFMGFEVMDRIRRMPTKYKTQRFGITPDGEEGPVSPDIDKRSNLTRTWIPSEHYTAPVEWTTADNELLITIFEGDGRYIRIQDETVARAFEQIWKLIDKNVQANPERGPYGPHSKRKK